MMENFNHKEYRDNLAKDLKETRKTDPQKAADLLESEKNTEKYQSARTAHLEEKDLQKINIDEILNELHIETKKEIKSFDEKAPKGWLNLGTSKPKYFMDILENFAQKSPDEVRMYKVLQDNGLRNPYGTKVGDYLKYYSPKIIQETKDFIKSKKIIENSENWLTKYGAMQELGISLERMNTYLIEYAQKEPDFIVTNELSGRTFLYKSLVSEIKERIQNGENEKIIPEGYQTLQQFSEDTLLKMKIDDPAYVIGYLFDEDKDIRDMYNAEIDTFHRVRQNSSDVIKIGKDLYFSPDFINLLKNKISDLENVEVPNGSETSFGLNAFERTEFLGKSKIDVLHLIRKFRHKFENKRIVKLKDGVLLRYYPPECVKEFEKQLADILK